MNVALAILDLRVFGRDEELEQLRKRLAARRSFLFHGPAGVGKTLLLRLVFPEFTDVLYSPQNPTPQSLYRNLAESLLVLEHPVLTKSCPRGTESLQAKTATSVKGLGTRCTAQFEISGDRGSSCASFAGAGGFNS